MLQTILTSNDFFPSRDFSDIVGGWVSASQQATRTTICAAYMQGFALGLAPIKTLHWHRYTLRYSLLERLEPSKLSRRNQSRTFQFSERPKATEEDAL